MEQIESDLKYFEYKLATIRNREGMAYANALRNYLYMKDICDMYKIINKKTDIGIKMFLKPHNF